MINNEKLKETILTSYNDFLREKGLEDSFESLELYTSYIFYDIQDNLNIECEEFSVPEDLEGIAAQKYIEGEIIKLIEKDQRKTITDILATRDGIWKTNFFMDTKENKIDRKLYIERLEKKYNCKIDSPFGLNIITFHRYR